jgi:hypothetical protein
MTADEFARAVGTEAAQEMDSALTRIKHCLNQLTDEQIWRRAAPSMNSVGNVILHLCGNVRQWLFCGLGSAVDQRNRPAEFSDRGPIGKAELIRRLETAVEEARSVLINQTAEGLLKSRRIQAQDVTGLVALFNSVPHFRGHTQELVYMTRLLLGESYQFAWQPRTVEEGAPA